MGKSPPPARLDALLVKRQLAANRDEAQQMILDGRVKVNGLIATKPTMRVRPDQPILLVDQTHQWVGRGAHKLLGALEAFKVDPRGQTCADFGASTGGFTEVLLHGGATKVFAIDVGRGQLDWKLREDPRVNVMEETNIRYLDALPEPMDLVVGDLSFISLTLILPAVHRVLRTGGEAILLIKPQFEVPKTAVQAGGVVSREEDRQSAIQAVTDVALKMGFERLNGRDCDVPGAKAGNVEYFLHLRR